MAPRALVLAAVSASACAAPATLTRVVLAAPALCLDGSPYSYYVAAGAEARKFLISYQGCGQRGGGRPRRGPGALTARPAAPPPQGRVVPERERVRRPGGHAARVEHDVGADVDAGRLDGPRPRREPAQ